MLDSTAFIPAYDGQLLAGVDEVGRGPLAGDVVAAAVILDSRQPIVGLNDSKKINENNRNRLKGEIKSQAIAWAVGWASATEIDDINILQATYLAMERAFTALRCAATLTLIDGRHVPPFLSSPAKAIIGGDGTEACISAASILAKTARDRHMVALDGQYPGYGFAQHKGYGTAKHSAALATLGPCPAHRKSFKPIAKLL